MGCKRTSSGMDALIGMPWPVGVLVGILLFSGVRYAIPWWFSRQDGGLAHGLASSFWQALSPFAWLLLAMCWMAALLSFLGARRLRILLDTRTTLESLAAPGWRQFEQLVGEAFRRQGYVVEETGLGGADGGIDLVLRKGSQRVLVQCKQWRRRQVGVSVVREMAGLLTHHRADGVKIVCLGTYTRGAKAFARGKSIELIDGVTLLEMIHAAKGVQRSAQAPHSPVEPVVPEQHLAPGSVKACARCGSTLVQRVNRRTGEHFLGCSRFPRCRGGGDQS